MTSASTPPQDESRNSYESGLLDRRRVLGDSWVDQSRANHAFGIATGILREKGLLADAPL
ncbi:hypothetical protein [Variovorax sp. YR216]|uniref:hypothetical protein n=1 Tax=Variovorax sp. YR216 TaxID=1882828 RepID=UPI0008987A22|nr:hypothetical protein [Variovorax sp. YR216]SEA22318.1 hypothetical protein SAMN05444680_101958 [Variovorax sp. YR216]